MIDGYVEFNLVAFKALVRYLVQAGHFISGDANGNGCGLSRESGSEKAPSSARARRRRRRGGEMNPGEMELVVKPQRGPNSSQLKPQRGAGLQILILKPQGPNRRQAEWETGGEPDIETGGRHGAGNVQGVTVGRRGDAGLGGTRDADEVEDELVNDVWTAGDQGDHSGPGQKFIRLIVGTGDMYMYGLRVWVSSYQMDKRIGGECTRRELTLMGMG
ncbi:hypothetical protein C8R44DRAFT_724293 [Mycena epipterygia]|nr:hypothetical protein C8R44DRAFT_724293 [Mycena epipterygia]